ncbi:WLM domain-containing protein [Thelephora terrestris]|uniref:WLM domain-containing protein n=1 Tax=Thelephora terrestris TaxID=56493 RepID=A0A9P6L775_9AGAM|nr:WLM domain-containing protein [Thelephora terrestris]
MTDVYIKSFTHLKDRRKADNALRLLQKVASLVKPIMRKRGWVLPVLSEFFPDNPNLVGESLCVIFSPVVVGVLTYINMGQTILLRLRPHFDPDAFFPEEDIVHTMLHELTHNVHGPHDDSFYKYLAGLESEYEGLKRSGYSGEGFYSRGTRLGVGSSHNLPPHLARLKALEAAEKRRNRSSGGGRRLGGGGTGKVGTFGGRTQLTPRELALKAAERRKRDNTACASGADAQREAEKAAKESVQSNATDLTLDLSDEEIQIIEKTSAASAGPSRLTPSSRLEPTAQTSNWNSRPVDVPRPSTPNSQITAGPVRPDPMAPPWTCETCTLINQPLALACDACLSPPPRDQTGGWVCLDCGAETQHEFWMCSLCGGIRTES